jgi:hypothetical protein
MADINIDHAWLAGLLEWEGSFSLTNQIAPRIRISLK